jgi:molybdate transport system substrate-binding protein
VPVAGARLVGPLPAELTNYVMYSTGLAPGIAERGAAEKFVAFLASPEATKLIRAKGMAPA